MRQQSRYLACAGYLLSLPGALYVLLARRDDAFAVYHARQSLRLAVIGIATPLAWIILAWISAWIPLVGGMLAVILFALLLAVYVGLCLSWVAGMVYSLKGQVRPLPLFGTPTIQRPVAQSAAILETPPERIERTTTSDA